jgi:rod shape determining protein RodA
MLTLKNKEQKLFVDWKIFIPSFLISVIGILTLTSTELSATGEILDADIIIKQIIFVAVGIIIYLLLSKLDLTYLKHWQVILVIYILTIVLLVATLIWGPVINNVKRWIIIGGVQIQPAEIAKATVILTTALIFSMKDKYNEWLLFLISFLFVIPIFILIYLQPSGSMSILVVLIWFVVAFTGLGNQLRNFLLLLIIGLISSGIFLYTITSSPLWFLLSGAGLFISILCFYARESWKIFVVFAVVLGSLLGIGLDYAWDNILHDYQKERVEAFIYPEETQEDIGFNVAQSRIAIGSGQIWGKGFGNGTQSKRNFLPEHQTDFIFASFAEEFGLVGSVILLGIYGFLIVVIFLVSMKYFDNIFFSMLTVGIGFKILLELFINIGTNTGTIPATGIPLPLMSAGGSITVMTFVCLGLIQAVKNSSRESITSASFIDIS